jgi:4-amino-4-deoxy-L-arabinose transferase-like glycosyltransferase
MLYWLMVIAAGIFQSTAEWVLRLPSALAAVATGTLLFFSVKRYLNRDIAVLAILILATSVSFVGRAHRAEIEMLLTFFCIAANLAFLKYYMTGKTGFLWLSYLSLGLGILTKGPVVLLFFVPPLLLFGLVERSRRVGAGLLFWRGWLLLLMIGGSWYVAIWFSAAGPYLRQVIEIDLVGKSLGGLSDSKPFYTYLVNLLGIFAPWTLIAIFRVPKAKALFTRPGPVFFTLQAFVPLLIMSLLASKHNKYILPMFPALAVCLAIFLRDFYGWVKTRYPARGKRNFTISVVALMILYFIFYAVVEPRLYRYRYSAFKPLLAKVYEVRDQAPLYCLCEKKFLQFIFYYDRPIPELEAAAVDEMIKAGNPFLLLAESHSWPLIEDRGLRTITEISPYRSRERGVRLLTNLSSPDLTGMK